MHSTDATPTGNAAATRRGDPSPADAASALRRAHRLADLLDQRYRLPGTDFRYGFDSIIGLIPVVGDTATLLVGLYPIAEGHRLGVRKRALAKMLGNLGVDWLLGLVPVLDIFLDAAYKANVKNVRVLERELEGIVRQQQQVLK
jgi:hypothetical protein